MCHLVLGQAQFGVGSVFLFKATILPQRGAACNLASAAEVDSGCFNIGGRAGKGTSRSWDCLSSNEVPQEGRMRDCPSSRPIFHQVIKSIKSAYGGYLVRLYPSRDTELNMTDGGCADLR